VAALVYFEMELSGSYSCANTGLTGTVDWDDGAEWSLCKDKLPSDYTHKVSYIYAHLLN